MNIHRGSDFNQFLIEEGITNTNQPMTPTPRTDAAEILWNDTGLCVVPAEFARYLERENQTFRAAQKACEDCDAPRVDRIAELERELAAEREQIAVWKHEAKRLEAELKTFDETAISWWCEYQDLKAKARET